MIMTMAMITKRYLSSDMLEEWEDVEISSSNDLLQHRMDHNVAAGPGDDDGDNDDNDDDDDDDEGGDSQLSLSRHTAIHI